MSAPGPIMLDLKAYNLDSEEREMLSHPACGGVILFSRNIEQPQQVSELIKDIRRVNEQLLIAVDQEGGRVQRLREGYTKLPALRQLELNSPNDQVLMQRTHAHATVMALETLCTGFDISFAPVLDVASETSRVIGDRAFHEDPQKITAIAQCYVRALKECGMAATGKHFPGHGTVDADSHLELPVDNRRFEEIAEHDLVPFARLASQLMGIMPAHIIYPNVDELPAGFSRYWVEEVLRKQLGFNGAVFSDDLSMKGAEVVGDYQARVDAALEAGCDMALVCNQPQEAGRLLEHLEGYRSKISEQRVAAMHSKVARTSSISDYKTDRRWLEAQDVLRPLFDD
ncbi:beta-N-acetylhexosaminidase [Pleionea litopenaei]|uniref:Beta-hexosaminidase n=1 Tax=Pleionea litopenaei TaxID=3070815 RepID=A0AA51RV33_9GAMM|nr:beta-N-acetylhexosaminidase [Pleionea sp. HL-JVS1]WMS88054.1 beta-N-acetylhexosaminidase [Pleionea sp. HL-JVS1]